MNKLIVFPLFFFLSFSISAYALNIDPTQETYVSQRFPTGNYSTICSYDLKTGPSNEWAWTYLKFNISGIPANATIINAYVSLYQLYSRTGTDRNVEVWNTTNNWTQYNITWNVKHDVSALQSNTSGVSYVTTGRKNFTITPAIVAAYASGIDTVSIALRDTVNASGTLYWADFGAHRCEATDYGYLVVNYNITDCSSSCGSCGCNAAGTDCYVPPIVGSYCAIEDGLPDSIKTVKADCTGTTYFACPNGTSCSQITPVFNITSDVVSMQSSDWCKGCWFIHSQQGFPSKYVIWATNCYEGLPFVSRIKTECDCYGIYCSSNIYNATNVTDVPYSIEQWSAGCFNPTTGLWSNIINGTGSNTTLNDMINETCPDCDLSNTTPTNCLANTSTTCYNEQCFLVQCTQAPQITCASNYGGQVALAVASVFGITDCIQSENITALIISLIVSIVIIFLLAIYGSVSEGLVNIFLGSNLLMLVLFTLIGWFPAWLIVILIVVSALGISGLLSKLLGGG